MINEKTLCEAYVCKKDECIVEISKVLRDLAIRHMIVVDDNDFPVGIISQTDIINTVVAEGKDPNGTLVSDIMLEDIITIDINESYDEAYAKMLEIRTFSIPVIKENKVIGILDFKNLVDYYNSQCNGG